jgi:uncharacterized protein (DUF1501 family)
MHDHTPHRRDFLKLLAASMPRAGLGIGSLAAMSNLSAQTATDSKFLVCLFLRGGNDQSNTIIPTTASEFAIYKNTRPAISLSASAPLAITPDAFNGPSLGLHPNLPFMAQLFNQGKAAIVANVGNLVVPTTKTQWNKGEATVPVPLQLFSHLDQETQWQTAYMQRVSQSGWLGRAADLLASTYNPSSSISMCMTGGRSSLMITGDKVMPYKITPTGSPKAFALNGIQYSAVAVNSLRNIYQQGRSSYMESQVSATINRSMSSEVLVTAAQSGVKITATFPSTPLGLQFYGVAKMMSSAKQLGQRRQVFYVDIDGFDFHDDLIERQANRLAELNAAIAAFYTYLQESGLWSQTVVFTGSDFGRALQSNGKGADHGWGGHQFVFGGPVRGKRVYGQWPQIALGSPDDAGQGRLIPTTSTDQYAATLASWLGVSSTDMRLVLPNIGNFASSNLGFLV